MTFVVTVKSDTSAAQGPAEKLVQTFEQAEVAGQHAGEAISRGARSSSSSLEASRRAAAQARDELGRFAREGSTSMQRASAATSDFASELHGLIATYASLHSIAKIAHFADEYTQISNRLSVVADDQANLNGLMRESFQVAQDTRTNWEQVATTYQRIASATEHMGVSQQEAMDLTRQIGQSLTVAGANAQEARMAMMELTHGFELGQLTGREFRVLLKDVTPLIGRLASALGYSRAEFVEMGKHGKITADMLREGFHKAGPDIQRDFEKMAPTMEQSFDIMKNTAIRFFGEAGAGSGVMRGLANTIKYVADHFEVFGGIVLGVGEALISLYVLDKIILLVRGLTAALLENPLGAILVLLVAAISLLRQFGDQLDAGIDGVTKISDVLGILWDDLKALGSEIGEFISGAWTSLVGAFSDGLPDDGIELSLKTVLMFIASFVDAGIALFKAMKQTLFGVFGGLTVGVGELFVDLARAVVSGVQAMINTIITGINAVLRAVNTVKNAVVGTIDTEGMAKRVKEGQAKGLTGDALREYALNTPVKESSAYQIGKVDMSFDNPLAGATDHARDLIRDAWGKDFGSSVARDFIGGWADGVEQRASNRANIRAGAQAVFDFFGAGSGGYVKTTGSGHAEPHVDEKAAKKAQSEYDRLSRQLDSIERASNPATKALAEYEKAIDVATRATHAINPATGEFMLSLGDANAIIAETGKRLADAIFPLEAWHREMDLEVNALAMSSKERERYNEILKATDDLRKKGVDITPGVRADIAERVDLKRSAELAARYRETGPLYEYTEGLAEQARQLQYGSINAKLYAESIAGLEERYFAATHAGKTFEDGLARGLHSIQATVSDTAADIETTLTNAFKGVEDSIVEMVVKGKSDWRSLVDSILANLTRLLLHRGLKALAGGFEGGAGGGGDAMSNLSTGLQALGFDALPGFAHGTPPGGLTVNGAPGIDTSVVAMRVSNGESVHVVPQGGNAPSSGPAARVTVVNVSDARAAALAALNSREGSQLIMNAIANNSEMIRGHVNKR